MANHSEDASCSLDDSDDLDDIPLSMARNGRYEHDDPPLTSRGPPLPFTRPGVGFHLNLPVPNADDLESPGANGLQAMRSEPAYLPDTSRVRAPPGLALALTQTRSYFTGTGEEAATLRNRRGPLKPPMLNLINPASASPVPSGAPTPAVDETGEGPSCLRNAWPPPGGRRGPVRVELVSTAFVLQNVVDDSSGETSTSNRITERCCRQLGIAACDLELYELRQLDEGVVPESCSHVGVMIRGSTFSMSGLEDMLARSKRDDQLATMLEGALRDSSQHAAETKEHAERLAKQNEELAVLRERLRCVEASNQHLREQLQRSDEHRQLLGGTIRTIKKEFEDFKSRVVVEGSVDQLSLQQLSLGSGSAPVGSPPLLGSGAGMRDASGRR